MPVTVKWDKVRHPWIPVTIDQAVCLQSDSLLVQCPIQKSAKPTFGSASFPRPIQKAAASRGGAARVRP